MLIVLESVGSVFDTNEMCIYPQLEMVVMTKNLVSQFQMKRSHQIGGTHYQLRTMIL